MHKISAPLFVLLIGLVLVVPTARGVPIVAEPGYSVELVATGARAADGIVIGTDGFVYVADFGGGR